MAKVWIKVLKVHERNRNLRLNGQEDGVFFALHISESKWKTLVVEKSGGIYRVELCARKMRQYARQMRIREFFVLFAGADVCLGGRGRQILGSAPKRLRFDGRRKYDILFAYPASFPWYILHYSALFATAARNKVAELSTLPEPVTCLPTTLNDLRPANNNSAPEWKRARLMHY